MSHVVSVFDGSNVWQQNFVWADTPDSVEMLEQADVLDYDSDGNTTEVTRSFYHRNALGSVMEITDANEAKVASYRYDPYGNMTITRGGVTQTSDPLGQHWGFTGRFQDEESGLWYYRARYYDSERGRFMQRDPLGYSEGPSLFVYADNRPATQRDPMGLSGLQQDIERYLADLSQDEDSPVNTEEGGDEGDAANIAGDALGIVGGALWDEATGSSSDPLGLGDLEARYGAGAGIDAIASTSKIGIDAHYWWRRPVGGGSMEGRVGVRAWGNWSFGFPEFDIHGPDSADFAVYVSITIRF